MTSSTTESSSLKIYLRLVAYLKPFLAPFGVSIIGYLIFASSQPMLAWIMKYFVDGLTLPAATTIRNIPLIGSAELMVAVPLLVVVISAWQGLAPSWATTISPRFPSA